MTLKLNGYKFEVSLKPDTDHGAPANIDGIAIRRAL